MNLYASGEMPQQFDVVYSADVPPDEIEISFQNRVVIVGGVLRFDFWEDFTTAHDLNPKDFRLLHREPKDLFDLPPTSRERRSFEQACRVTNWWSFRGRRKAHRVSSDFHKVFGDITTVCHQWIPTEQLVPWFDKTLADISNRCKRCAADTKAGPGPM